MKSEKILKFFVTKRLKVLKMHCCVLPYPLSIRVYHFNFGHAINQLASYWVTFSKLAYSYKRRNLNCMEGSLFQISKAMILEI